MKALVLVIHGLQAGYVGAYGNDWVGTPALDQFAAEGIVFDQHHADRPDLEGAHHAWRKGRHHFPRLDRESSSGRGSAKILPPDLIDSLRAAGVVTSLVSDRLPPSPAFATGWSHVFTTDESESTVESALEAAGEALDEMESAEHSLLWLELNTLLPPWSYPAEFFEEASSPESDAEDAAKLEPLTAPTLGLLGDDPHDVTFRRLQETYAAALRYVDAGVEQLLEAITDEEMLIIITSDAGLPLGEHGMVGVHRPWLHEELVHLPLMMRLPGGVAGQRVPALTQPVDLMPTLLEFFGVPLPDALHGHGLAPFFRGEEMAVRDYACSGLQVGLAIEWAIRTRDWALLIPLQGEIEDTRRQAQLYAKPEDRWEANDLQQHHLELADALQQVAREFGMAAAQPGPLHPPPLPDLAAQAALRRS